MLELPRSSSVACFNALGANPRRSARAGWELNLRMQSLQYNCTKENTARTLMQMRVQAPLIEEAQCCNLITAQRRTRSLTLASTRTLWLTHTPAVGHSPSNCPEGKLEAPLAEVEAPCSPPKLLQPPQIRSNDHTSSRQNRRPPSRTGTYVVKKQDNSSAISICTSQEGCFMGMGSKVVVIS